jgi:hypothetical protein
VLEVVEIAGRLRREARWWNGRLYLAGSAQGAVVAAEAARRLPDVAAWC